MRLVCLIFVLLGGCAAHGQRCDAHLTPINQPVPPTAAAEAKTPGEVKAAAQAKAPERGMP